MRHVRFWELNRLPDSAKAFLVATCIMATASKFTCAFWLAWNPGRSLNCRNARSMQRSGCLVSSECRHGPRFFSSSTSPQKQMKAILTTSPTGSCLSTVARGRMQASTSKARRSDAVQVVRRTRSERKRAFRVLIETHSSFGIQFVLASV